MKYVIWYYQMCDKFQLISICCTLVLCLVRDGVTTEEGKHFVDQESERSRGDGLDNCGSDGSQSFEPLREETVVVAFCLVLFHQIIDGLASVFLDVIHRAWNLSFICIWNRSDVKFITRRRKVQTDPKYQLEKMRVTN